MVSFIQWNLKGYAVEALQKLLDHEDTEGTEIYIQNLRELCGSVVIFLSQRRCCPPPLFVRDWQ